MSEWAGKELFTPCFEVDLVGATGAGDTSIAGFLAEMSLGRNPEDALMFATGVGGFACEAPDATGGICSQENVRERIAKGWGKQPLSLDTSGWDRLDSLPVWKKN